MKDGKENYKVYSNISIGCLNLSFRIKHVTFFLLFYCPKSIQPQFHIVCQLLIDNSFLFLHNFQHLGIKAEMKKIFA